MPVPVPVPVLDGDRISVYLYGPRKLPPTLVNRLVKVFGEATHTAAYVVDGTNKNGLVVNDPLSREALEQFLRDDRDKTWAMVKRLGLMKD